MTAFTRELERTRNGAKVMERTLEDASLRIKELEDLIKSILLDLSERAQMTDEPDLIDLSNGLILRAAALLEKT